MSARRLHFSTLDARFAADLLSRGEWDAALVTGRSVMMRLLYALGFASLCSLLVLPASGQNPDPNRNPNNDNTRGTAQGTTDTNRNTQPTTQGNRNTQPTTQDN